MYKMIKRTEVTKYKTGYSSMKQQKQERENLIEKLYKEI